MHCWAVSRPVKKRCYRDLVSVGESIVHVAILSGGASGHPDRGSSFPDRGAEVSAGITLPCNPPTSSHYIGYTVRSRHN